MKKFVNFPFVKYDILFHFEWSTSLKTPKQTTQRKKTIYLEFQLINVFFFILVHAQVYK